MLPFHEQIVSELVQGDGLVVMGAGLGLPKILAALLHLHSSSDGIVLVLSVNDNQRQYLREELQALDGNASRLLEINNEYTGADRVNFYSEGGAYLITSRILIVDMLNERVPLRKIRGMIFTNAHRITETCAEAFIVRLYRQANKTGWVRAFSDRPQAMITGFSKTERIMKSLFVRNLYLWPRFQLAVSSCLEENPPEVIDIRMPLTSAVEGIQSAILEVMDACLKELRKSNKVDVEDLTVENGLFKSFDDIIRRQLDPIWHTVGRKTKQLLNDLKTLRKLAEYLLRYDAVTFLKYLDTLRVSEGVRSVWIFAKPTHRIFEFAKRRVYRIVASESKSRNADMVGTSNNKAGRSSKRKHATPSDISIIKTNGVGIHQGQQQNSKRRKSTTSVVGNASGGLKTYEGVSERTGTRDELDKTGDENSVPSIAGNGSNSGKDLQEVELDVVVEEMPKWTVLREVLEEIEEERLKSSATHVSVSQDAWGDGGGVVLVACKDERTCLQLQDCVTKGTRQLMREEWNGYLLGKAELTGMRMRNKKKTTHGIQGIGVLNGMEQGNRSSVEEMMTNALMQEQDALLAAAAEVAANVVDADVCSEHVALKKPGKGKGRGQAEGAKQPKKGLGQKQSGNESNTNSLGRGKKKVVAEDAGSSTMRMEQETLEKAINESKALQEEGTTMKRLPPVHFYAMESEQRVLDLIRPQYVVIYDPDMSFVRELEVYKAENPSRPLKVYFLIYEQSMEASKFEVSIKRENNAFESLIRQKASMMIPVDQDGRLLDSQLPLQSATGLSLNGTTRKAGGRKASETQVQIIVDIREFGSSLPSVLHQQGMRILPVKLEVGDYILSPDICVERKSIADLFASFTSGRLYHQAETMIRYYRLPVLLIEFSQERSFSLQSANDLGEDITPANIVSKLSLLVLHFPRLRIVWSRSLHATADIFTTLKANQDEPDLERAMHVGVPTEDGLYEGDLRAENFNTTAVELLRRLPGVTDANYRSIMDGCESLSDLAIMPLEKLAELMGGQRPARMLRDFLDAKCPTF